MNLYHEAPVVMAQNAVPIDEAALEKHHILAHRTGRSEADHFRILRTQILSLMSASGLRTLGVTSPNYGDGKTTVALNLALSIALDLKQTVLLVDLDLRKPDMMGYLGVNAPHGLSDYFAGRLPLSECFVRPSFDRLLLLPAGQKLAHSSEVLGSPKIAMLAGEMKQRYDDRIVIYDLPPVLAQDDPLVFLPHIDALLMVINQGITKVEDVKTTLRRLGQANVIGTVLNEAPPRRVRYSHSNLE